MSPDSNRGSAARPPMTPHTGNRHPRSPMKRSMTSPVPRINRPPSMELSSNLDSPFPPFPKTGVRSSSSNSKPKNTGMFAQENSLMAMLHAEPETYIGPKSPRTNGGADVLQKMNTIAPGPFDTRRRASSEEAASQRRSPAPQPQAQQDPTSLSYISAHPTAAAEVVRDVAPSTENSHQSPSLPVPFVAVAPPTNKEGRPVPQRPVRPEPLDGFLAMLKSETEAATTRSESPKTVLPSSPLPVSRSGATDVSIRIPSEPRPLDGSLRSTPLPPSSLSASPNTTELKIKTALKPSVPPMPPLSTLHPYSHQHTIHTSSDSASSTSSTKSFAGSGFRFEMSPPISATSSVSMLSSSSDDGRGVDATPLVRGLQVRNEQSQPQWRAAELEQSVSPALLGETTANMLESPLREIFTTTGRAPESPIVPSFPSPPSKRPIPSRSGALPSASAIPGGQADLTGKQQKPSVRRPGTASKHTCRGCNQPIMGKSVKAADGRLTGRYHKHCE